jgi:hypothetical protein
MFGMTALRHKRALPQGRFLARLRHAYRLGECPLITKRTWRDFRLESANRSKALAEAVRNTQPSADHRPKNSPKAKKD